MARHQPASQRRRTPAVSRSPASVPDAASHRVPPPRKRPNTHWRSREYLTAAEVETLMDMAKPLGRHRHRDATTIQLAYRHGLRVAELIALRWDQVDLRGGLLHVRRRKNGLPSAHPLYGVELRALRQLAREYPDTRCVFVTERKGPMTDSTFRKAAPRATALFSRRGTENPVGLSRRHAHCHWAEPAPPRAPPRDDVGRAVPGHH